MNVVLRSMRRLLASPSGPVGVALVPLKRRRHTARVGPGGHVLVKAGPLVRPRFGSRPSGAIAPA